MAKEQLNVSEMKKIAHDIISKEKEENNINLNVFPVTFVEYYNQFVAKNKYKLYRSFQYLRCGGFNDLEGNAYLFLSKINKFINIERKVFRLAQVCYHEGYHSIQQKFDPYSYDGFLRDMDLYIRKIDNFDYRLSHDDYSFEIGANLYSVSKAREYMKKEYPQLYEKQKNEIDGLEKRYMFDYLTYDVVLVVDRIIREGYNKYKSYSSNINLPMFFSMVSVEKASPVLDIFLNRDFTFKRPSQIIENDKYSKLDKRIISAMFSCKYFLESVNMEDLSSEELQNINEALQYTSDVYQNQTKLIEKSYKDKVISVKEYLNLQKSLLVKVSFIDALFKKNITNKFNYKRSDSFRKDRIERVNQSLIKSKKYIKKNGFLVSDMFYFIGLLFSLLTIISLMLVNG